MTSPLFISRITKKTPEDSPYQGHVSVHTEAEVKHKKAIGFIQAKNEKLATAIYMVTSYMTDSDPVRNVLRETSITLLGTVKELTHKKDITLYQTLEKDILHILSLLSLSKTIGLMSHMNATILETEYQNLQAFIERQKNIKDREVFHLEIDDEGEVHMSTITETENELHLNHSSPKGSQPVREVPVTASTDLMEKREVLRDQTKVSSKEKKERKVSRREQLLGLLDHSAPTTIRDIATRIKGCSEKTIQRELNALLDEKKIKRLGEKRWSKYLLA